MIAIGMLFIATTLYASYLRWRGTLFTTRWLLWYFVFAVVLAIVANEVGLGHGRSRPATVDRVSDDDRRRPRRRTAHERRRLRSDHRANTCSLRSSCSASIYLLLFVLWIILLNNKIQHGPEPVTSRKRHTKPEGLIEAASRRPDHRGSLTEPRDANQQGEHLMDLNILWFILLGVLLAGYAILDGFDSRCRHPAAGCQNRRRAAHCSERHRPDLGRQRSLARHVRRRDVRRVSRSVRHRLLRLLHRVHADAVRRSSCGPYRSSSAARSNRSCGAGFGTSVFSLPACSRRCCSARQSAPP